MKNILFICCFFIFNIVRADGMAQGCAAPVQKIYVNNLTGNDSYDGRSIEVKGQTGPFKTIQKALNEVAVSGHIDIANTGIPYQPGNRLKKGGTAEKPLIIEGNHAVICGLQPVKEREWELVEQNIYRMPFWPMSNHLKINNDFTSWIGSPQIWRLDGRPAKNCRSEQELRNTPGGFWWNKAEKMVWMQLPEGSKLSVLKISVPSKAGTCFNVSGAASHIIVRNLRAEYSFNDGFSAHDQVTGLVFKNCVALDNCGQGFSMHGNTKVKVENGLASGNASSGACDVGSAEVLYLGCVFVDNTFEAGVYAAENTEVHYQDCLIMDNEPFEQLWQRGKSKMIFNNCLIRAKGEGNVMALVEQGQVRLEHCSINEFNALTSSRDGAGSVQLRHCLVTGFTEPVSGANGPGAKLPPSVWDLYEHFLSQNKLK